MLFNARAAAFAALLVFVGACSSSSESSSGTSPPAAASTTMKLDRSKVGAECESFNDCPNGTQCAWFSAEGIDEKHCVAEPLCAPVTCTARHACAIRESSPAQITCARD